MFGQYGNIIFDNLVTPRSVSVSDEASWVEHPLINSKSVLQNMGNELRKLSIDIDLRQEFCNVEESLTQLNAYLQAGASNVLLMGNGKVIGNFVLASVKQNWDKTEPQTGALIAVSLTLSLTEFFIRDPLKFEKIEAKKKATSQKKGSSTSKKKVKYDGSCNKNVSEMYSQLQSIYKKLGAELKLILPTVNAHTFVARKYCDFLASMGGAVDNSYYPCVADPMFKEYGSQIIDAAKNIKTLLGNPTNAQYAYDNSLTPAVEGTRKAILPNMQKSMTGHA